MLDMIGMVNESETTKFSQEVNNFTLKDKNLGNWKITIEKMD